MSAAAAASSSPVESPTPVGAAGSPAASASASASASTAASAASSSSAAPSKSALKRARHKKSAAAKAEATQRGTKETQGSARGHGHGGHGGHGGHDHGHGHSHSHGGVPCGGHGPDSGLSGGVSSEDMSEAVHYTDVLWHFQSYATHSFQRLERMHSDFSSIPTSLQQLVPTFEDRMARLRRAVRANHEFLQEIVSHRYVFHSSDDIDYEALEAKVAREHPIDEERMSKVRSTLRQCVRDWSVEGATERDACYGPILSELERLYPDTAARSDVRVLVPGSGLGRLVWEVAHLGFQSSGNEFSYQMLLCSFLILNCCKEKNIFTIYPYVHDSKNLYAVDDQLRSVTIPDVNPSQLPPGAQLSMVAGDWLDIFSDLPSEYIHGGYARKMEKERRRQMKFRQAAQKWEARRREEAKVAAAAAKAGTTPPAAAAAAAAPMEEEVEEPVPDPVRGPGTTTGPMGEVETKASNAATWDVFASCYFVDCANNILEYLRTIAYVLKPGGYWINFGPLLYHFSEVPREVSVDLSWEELRRAAPAFGFRLLREELNQPSAYTSDERSMLRSQYFCVSCTWQKVGEDQTSRPLSLRAPLEEPKSVAWQSRLRNDDACSLLTIASSDAALAQLLTVSGARRVREAASLPSGLTVDVYQLHSTKLGQFLLQACSDRVSVGKIVLEEVEMLALLPKP